MWREGEGGRFVVKGITREGSSRDKSSECCVRIKKKEAQEGEREYCSRVESGQEARSLLEAESPRSG